MVDKQQIADQLAAKSRELSYGGTLVNDDVKLINQLAAQLYSRFPIAKPTVTTQLANHDMLTAKAAVELVSHEAIVLEWYRDSEGVGTWGIGVTNASGHNVDRYKDKPQTIEHVLAVFIWLLRNKYVPDVVNAFAGVAITEAQFAAALSFHYNTGAIGRADWVAAFKRGSLSLAKDSFMNYRKPAAIIPRREAERDLFFDGVWSNDGTTTVWPVKKPSYTPNWGAGQKVDIRQAMAEAMTA